MAEQAVLAPMTWFRVGGPAEFLLRPADVEDLCEVLRELPLEMPVTVIGAASNLIIRDGGMHGVVIKLARGFGEIVVEAGWRSSPGAAALDVTVAEHAAAASLAGLEFLSGIPGTIGGAVAMNAGAYGGDMSQVLDWAEIVTRSGELVRVPAAELGFDLPPCESAAGCVVVRARLRARPGERGDDRGADGGDQGQPRGDAAGARAHRRLHLRQPAGAESLGADRCRRVPGLAARGSAGFRIALQFPAE